MMVAMTLRTTCLLSVLLVSLGQSQAGDGILGVWRVEDGEAHIELAPCGDELCGTIVWLDEPLLPAGVSSKDVNNPDPALRDHDVLGLRILKGVSSTPNKHGFFRGGRIYDPESGRTYRCTLSMSDDDRLRMKGYIGIPLFGRSTYWSRFGSKFREASVSNRM